MNLVFKIITYLDNFYWNYVGFFLVISSGLYFTIISKGLQFRILMNFQVNIKQLAKAGSDKTKIGIHPFKLYFASVGGMIGLGNIIVVSTALFIGGPGSIFWMIIANLCGMIIKYSEIYLGVKYRVANERGGFDGGPMYFLQHSYKSKIFAYIVAVMLCIYGVEVYQFVTIVDRLEYSFEFNRYIIILTLLAFAIYSVMGGVNRVAVISSFMMPVFMIFYILFALYVIIDHIQLLPSFYLLVIKSAFQGQAPLGGFIGSTMIMAAYLGTSKSIYSGDIAIGYDSIVQSETRISDPKLQASMAIYALLVDGFICILTNTMVGVTGAWHKFNNLNPSDVVAQVLNNYLPNSDFFMTLLIFFAGFTTVISYLIAGMKCAKFLSPKFGRYLYLAYAIFAMIFFCNFDQTNVLSIMGLASGILVLINLLGIIRLRNKIDFNV